MMQAAVAMFYALFGPSQQHTLAFTMPGLTKRGSGLMELQLKRGFKKRSFFRC